MLGNQDTDRKVPEPVFFLATYGVDSAGDAIAAHALTMRDRIVHVYESNDTAAYAITLPPCAEAAGTFFSFTTVESLATYNVTVQDQNDSFDWVDILLTGNDESLVLYSDGRKWHIISGNVVSLEHTELVATYQVLRSDNGKTFYLNHSTEFTTTLPSIANAGPGFRVRFVIKAAPSGANYVITELGTADTDKVIVNGITELETDTGDDGVSNTGCTFINFISGSAIAGDWVEFFCDGANWYATGLTKADGGITAT